MSGNYSRRKGYRFEARARRLLEATGHTVIRAGGSLGVFDLLAWVPGGTLRAVQVKGGQKPWVSEGEREAMALAPLPAGATRELWRWRDYQPRPEIELL